LRIGIKSRINMRIKFTDSAVLREAISARQRIEFEFVTVEEKVFTMTVSSDSTRKSWTK